MALNIKTMARIQKARAEVATWNIEKEKAALKKDGSVAYHYTALDQVMGKLNILMDRLSLFAHPTYSEDYAYAYLDIYLTEEGSAEEPVRFMIKNSPVELYTGNAMQAIGAGSTLTLKYLIFKAFGICEQDEEALVQNSAAKSGKSERDALMGTLKCLGADMNALIRHYGAKSEDELTIESLRDALSKKSKSPSKRMSAEDAAKSAAAEESTAPSREADPLAAMGEGQ